MPSLLTNPDLPEGDRAVLAAGVDLFNRQEFYTCHDTLEDLWHDALQPQRQFYQGILQIAVGYYHLRNGNHKGSAILLGEGLGRLEYFAPSYAGIDVKALCDRTLANLSRVQSLMLDPTDTFVWADVPSITLVPSLE